MTRERTTSCVTAELLKNQQAAGLAPIRFWSQNVAVP